MVDQWSQWGVDGGVKVAENGVWVGAVNTGKDDEEGDEEEGILIYSTVPAKDDDDQELNTANIDPRWAALQQLKDK